MQAGRLIEKKGFATSLRAFAEFAAHYPESTLTIAGEGPLQQQLQSQARDLGVTNKMLFRGFISQKELRELFYSSHIFLHPSETGADGNQEGVPNSMLEAMVSGLPVFATIHGGIPEAIENDRSGILIAERDHQALAKNLLELVTIRRSSFRTRATRRGISRGKIQRQDAGSIARRFLFRSYERARVKKSSSCFAIVAKDNFSIARRCEFSTSAAY